MITSGDYKDGKGSPVTIMGRIKRYSDEEPWVYSLQGNWYHERTGQFVDSVIVCRDPLKIEHRLHPVGAMRNIVIERINQPAEFVYTNRGPSPWNVVRSNLIRLRRDGSKVLFDLFYIGRDGERVEDPITSEFEGAEINAANIARMIHWGCCGWSDRGTTQLFHFVEAFLKQ